VNDISNFSPIHFIFASPRSGTTWLADALNQHPDVLSTEQRLFGDFCELWPDLDGEQSARQTFDYFGRHFLRHYQDSFIGKTPTPETRHAFQNHWMEQMLRNIVDLGLTTSGKKILVDKVTPYLGTSGTVLRQVLRFFPNAKVIHLVRDGRDVVTSGTFDWVTRSDPHSERYRFYVSREPKLTLTRFFDDDILETWCRYWKEPQAAADHWQRQGVFDGRWLTVHYEDMLTNQASELGKICEFLGVRNETTLVEAAAAAASFQTRTGRPRGAGDPTAKARKGIHGDWQNYFTRHDAQLFDRHCGHWLFHHQYVRDRGWLDDRPEAIQLSTES
jgi:hypothetical protein